MRSRQAESAAQSEEEGCSINDGNQPHAKVQYEVMDVTQLEYEAESVASVLDKATLDTMCNVGDDLCAAHCMLAGDGADDGNLTNARSTSRPGHSGPATGSLNRDSDSPVAVTRC
eukprot:1192051-Prorocentrum_minimum.AAC.4